MLPGSAPATPIETDLAFSEGNLVWLDMEMTGLRPEANRIIEVAVIVTDSNLETAVEGPVLALYQSDATLESMDPWNQKMHRRSGLIERVRASTLNERGAAEQLLAFLSRYVPAGKSPLCGNSVCQDRRFMARWMPDLEAFFHYRNLDVSTLKELCRRWQPELYRGFHKHGLHTALADIQESIAELKYYRAHFIRLAPVS